MWEYPKVRDKKKGSLQWTVEHFLNWDGFHYRPETGTEDPERVQDLMGWTVFTETNRTPSPGVIYQIITLNTTPET